MANHISLMKKQNRLALLRLLRREPLSRAELARRTGLTRAAVTLLTDEMIAEGLMLEGEVTKTAVGRHPTMLRLDPAAYYEVGVDISREGVTLCVTDFTLQTVLCRNWSREIPPEGVIAEIGALLKELQGCYPLLGVGVSAPGPVDVVEGRILTPEHLDEWHGFSVAALAERWGLPVRLERDTGALALAEKSSVGTDADFLVLLADHGLGAGFVYEGKLFSSAAGYGCELGHICIDLNGPACHCGNRGCAELYVSIPAIMKEAEKIAPPVSWAELAARALAGEQPYRALLDRQAEVLATVCVSAVNLLEPEYILLEGGLRAACPYLAEVLQEKLSSRCFSAGGRAVRVIPSALPEHARAVAAAALILENYFDGGNGHDRFGATKAAKDQGSGL